MARDATRQAIEAGDLEYLTAAARMLLEVNDALIDLSVADMRDKRRSRFWRRRRD